MVKLIIESSTDMAASLREKVAIIPLPITFGEKTYLDGVDINKKGFYEKLISGKDLPTTSQASPMVFGEYFAEAIKAGDTVVCLTISAKLSGNYQSACIAAEEYPDQVFVVDSLNATVGAGILAEYALGLIEQGLSAQEIAEELTRKRDQVRLVAMVDTLEYLKRGGRVSTAVALAGGLLHIKPLVCLEDGEVKMKDKARGGKQAAAKLTEMIQKVGGIDPEMPLLLGYAGLTDENLQEYLQNTQEFWKAFGELDYTEVGSAVGTHVGPGAVAISFFARTSERY